MNRFARKLLRRERGTAAVELALILPLLLLILFGVIEWGKVFSQIEVYAGMAREGARCAAVQQAEADTAGVYPPCNIYTSITGAIPAQGLYKAPALSAVTVSVNGASYPGWLAGPPYACTNRIGSEVTVSWTQPLTVNIAFFGTLTMSHPIKATFRCE